MDKQDKGQEQFDFHSFGLKGKAVFFCLFSIALMFLDHRTDFLRVPKYYLEEISYPLSLIAESPSRTLNSLQDWYTEKEVLLQRIETLEEKELYLAYETQQMAALTAENKRLRLLLQSSSKLEHSTIIAELININSDPYRHIVMLNQGASQGVEENLPVLNNLGIVGQTISASPSSSKVILLTDPHHSLPIEVNRNGIRGIANGNGKLNEIEISNIAFDDDVKVGDLLVTSGLDERFPQGYPVAIIKTITVDSTGYFAKIIATPTAKLDRIREVLILSNGGDHELD
ncbi:MAG TPA: rod shape-determining protein MreC [Candidatus Ignatzschineria merdigallinarum]|uniref:Cell shape-determining protein MreC n=1 Tax=Candidatus Ignatzschineria merdigallinarum TaxID=2838621 RepID=A0A9D1Q705_9GAMM|nr:rod shape-determining protein MreC [Candidatus Ignatzschineria merdigallinarum]